MKKQLIALLTLGTLCLTGCGSNPHKVTKKEWDNFFNTTDNYTFYTTTKVSAGDLNGVTTINSHDTWFKLDGDLAEIKTEDKVTLILNTEEMDEVSPGASESIDTLLEVFFNTVGGGEVTKDGTKDGIWEATYFQQNYLYEEKQDENTYITYSVPTKTYITRELPNYLDALTFFVEKDVQDYSTVKYDNDNACYSGSYTLTDGEGFNQETQYSYFFENKKLTKYMYDILNNGQPYSHSETLFSDYGTTEIESFDKTAYTEVRF